jgi:AbrB family looped-hinge helix DNA binding protein
MANSTVTMSAKGQVVIPAALRKAFGLKQGTQFLVDTNESGDLILKKIPDRADLEKLLANIPNEVVEFDDNGHYDSKKSPDFDDWMKNG